MRFRLAVAALLAVALCGCNATRGDALARTEMARGAYTGGLQAATALRKAGRLGDDKANGVESARRAAAGAIAQMEAAAERGDYSAWGAAMSAFIGAATGLAPPPDAPPASGPVMARITPADIAALVSLANAIGTILPLLDGGPSPAYILAAKASQLAAERDWAAVMPAP